MLYFRQYVAIGNLSDSSLLAQNREGEGSGFNYVRSGSSDLKGDPLGGDVMAATPAAGSCSGAGGLCSAPSPRKEMGWGRFWALSDLPKDGDVSELSEEEDARRSGKGLVDSGSPHRPSLQATLEVSLREQRS